MAKRQNAAIAPDQIERDGEDRVAEIFAEQLHQIRRQIEAENSADTPSDSTGTRMAATMRIATKAEAKLVEPRAHASTARPRRAKSPRGRL